jgi:hypothetical protein
VHLTLHGLGERTVDLCRGQPRTKNHPASGRCDVDRSPDVRDSSVAVPATVALRLLLSKIDPVCLQTAMRVTGWTQLPAAPEGIVRLYRAVSKAAPIDPLALSPQVAGSAYVPWPVSSTFFKKRS